MHKSRLVKMRGKVGESSARVLDEIRWSCQGLTSIRGWGKNVQVNPTLEEDYQKQPYHTNARPLSCLYKKCIAQIHFDPPLLSRPSQQTVTLRHFLTETKLCMKNQHS